MKRWGGIFIFILASLAVPALAVEYTAGDARDPFTSFAREAAKPDAAGKPEEPFELSGLVWGNAMPQAILNGTIIRVGDKIDSAEVLEISKEGVRLKSGSEELWVRPKSGLP